MSTTRKDLKEEVIINLKLKVKLTQASHTAPLTDEEMKQHIEEAKLDLANTLFHKIDDVYYNEELSKGVYYNFEVEHSK